jgi:ABC-type Na+ efflux pump permease subunit
MIFGENPQKTQRAAALEASTILTPHPALSRRSAWLEPTDRYRDLEKMHTGPSNRRVYDNCLRGEPARIMRLEPFLKRELIISARRKDLFRDRLIVASIVTGVVAGCLVIISRSGLDLDTGRALQWLGLVAFSSIVSIVGALVLAQIPAATAAAIAIERDRKTLDSLLATRVSSADIVLGSFMSGLIKSASVLVAALPILILVVWLGGVAPFLLFAAATGITSTALALAALGIAVSAHGRTAQRATGYALLAALTWMCLPLVLVVMLPRLWPGAAWLVIPPLLWVADSSPFGLALNLIGLIGRAPPLEALLRMIALQGAAACFFLAWACWRLRPASRALHEFESRTSLLRGRRGQIQKRPACGNDPVLWNEMYSTRGLSRLDRILSGIVNFGMVAAILVTMSSFAWPAFCELLERGYGSNGETRKPAEFHPLARAIVARAMKSNTMFPRGPARMDFNIMLKQASATLGLFYVLMIAGAAAESIATERERDTWLGLLATPLSAEEILRAKILGAFWRVRGLVLLLLVLWVMGLLTGAVHPLGFVAALGTLAATGACFAALGVHTSLWASTRKRAIDKVFPLLMLITFTGILPLVLPLGTAKVFVAASSSPYLLWASVLGFEDTAAIVLSEPFPQLAAIGIRENALVVMAAWLIGFLAHALVARSLIRRSLRSFDHAVDRPRRAVRNRSPAPPYPSPVPIPELHLS